MPGISSNVTVGTASVVVIPPKVMGDYENIFFQTPDSDVFVDFVGNDAATTTGMLLMPNQQYSVANARNPSSQILKNGLRAIASGAGRSIRVQYF